MASPSPATADLLHLFAPGPLDLSGARAIGVPLSPIEWCVLVSVSDRLFELNERGVPEPNLISSYAVSGNGTIYRFQIHGERRFHNGEEVTSDDVIQSLTDAATHHPEGSRLHDLVGAVPGRGGCPDTGLRRISRYRFEVQLKDRCDDFLRYLALPFNSIASRQASSDAPDRFSGPYRVRRQSPAEWELQLDITHPAAVAGVFERIIVHCAAAGEPPPDPAESAARGFGLVGPDALPSHHPSVVLFDTPFPVPHRPPVGFKERLARLPGERLFYLRWRADAEAPELLGRALRAALEAPALQRTHYGLKPPGFLPAVPSGPGDRAGGGARPPRRGAWVVAFEPGELRADLLEAVAAECRARGADVRFVPRAAEVESGRPSGCHAYLRSIFVGHSTDEVGFLRRLSEESLPGCRPAGKAFAAALTAARKAPDRNSRADAVRLLAQDLAAELGVMPVFQAATGLRLDPRIDREALASAAGFTSLVSLRRRSARFDHAELNQAMLSALGAATQMFAHDVRRPFSMVRILLDMVRSAGSLAEVREMAERMMPDIERALGAVDGMIQDILEIGTAREPLREVVSPQQILDASLRAVFETRSGADVRFRYRLAHTRPFHACPHQVQRVFANILTNAADAMQNRGEIRCETDDVVVGGQLFVRVALRNTGAAIDPADLPRIFDAFFSKGKRGGTGLGLAITKKVIEAHEGRIWCVSDPREGVQFCFTLPAHESPNEPAPALPLHSRDIVEDYLRRTALSLSDDERRSLEREKQLAGNVLAFRQAQRRRLRLWVIDDELIYAEGIRNLVKDAYWFADNVEIVPLRTAAEAYAALAGGAPDACICDIDLGADSPDGFAVTAELRQRGLRGIIYIHSNRSVPSDYRHAIEVGADAFLPKPMSRPHLLRLLDETTRESRPAADEAEVEAAAETAGALPLLIVVDDDIFMRKAWAKRVQDAEVRTFRGPTEFWSMHGDANLDWSRIQCIITDYHFGAGEPEPIEDFVPRLRAASYRGPVILSSDAASSESLASLTDGRIEKRPIPWSEIRRRLEETKP